MKDESLEAACARATATATVQYLQSTSVVLPSSTRPTTPSRQTAHVLETQPGRNMVSSYRVLVD